MDILAVFLNCALSYITMECAFTQAIAQYASLRTFARISTPPICGHPQLIRILFPKALFNKTHATIGKVFEIAWSFLSVPVCAARIKTWQCEIGQIPLKHRIGGLPAVCTHQCQRWYCRGENHRDDIDKRTGLTLPALIQRDSDASERFMWYYDGEVNRTDRCMRTNLILPAIITVDASHKIAIVSWIKNGRHSRTDKEYGITLPALITPTHKLWYIKGVLERNDKDPHTGLLLPSSISSDGTLEWYWNGKLHRTEIDEKTGKMLPARITKQESEWWIRGEQYI